MPIEVSPSIACIEMVETRTGSRVYLSKVRLAYIIDGLQNDTFKTNIQTGPLALARQTDLSYVFPHMQILIGDLSLEYAFLATEEVCWNEFVSRALHGDFNELISDRLWILPKGSLGLQGYH